MSRFASVQTDLFAPLIRFDVSPSGGNGLRVPSQIAVDRVRRERLGPTIGRLDNGVMLELHRALAVFLGLV